MKKLLEISIIMFLILSLIPGTINATMSSEISPASHLPGWRNMKVSEFIRISAKDYYVITGKKMNLKEKIGFMFLKRDMKHALKKNPELKVGDYIAGKKPINTVGIVLLVIVALGLILFLVVISNLPS